MTIEMRDAYPPEADLASLRRTVALHRDTPAGWVEVVDQVAFATQPGTLEAALFTFGTVALGEGEVLVHGTGGGAVRIAYDPTLVRARVEHLSDLDLSTGRAEAERIVFSLASPARTAAIRVMIVPAE